MKRPTLSHKVVISLLGLAIALAGFLNIFMKPVYGNCHQTDEGRVCSLVKWEWK